MDKPPLFLNDRARASHLKTFRDLVEMARNSPEAVDAEIERLLTHPAHQINGRDTIVWMMGYLHALTARQQFTHDSLISEMLERLDKAWGGGAWSYMEVFSRGYVVFERLLRQRPAQSSKSDLS